jgi:hypothetical protein
MKTLQPLTQNTMKNYAIVQVIHTPLMPTNLTPSLCLPMGYPIPHLEYPVLHTTCPFHFLAKTKHRTENLASLFVQRPTVLISTVVSLSSCRTGRASTAH